MVASIIGEQDEILLKKLHISYVDQFVVPPIFKYLIGAKDVEIRPACIFDWNDGRVCIVYTDFAAPEHLIGPENPSKML